MTDSPEVFLDALKFDGAGLVGSIIQDIDYGEILMFAFTNREAIRRTLETGKVHFWSRSRGKLWLKGETSGHVQELVEARIDCDGDCLLLKVRQAGGACHEGYRSCFFRRWTGQSFEVPGTKVFDPKQVY
ncbi:MAG: phosphoribosyl-AMP cyclohydrolase [Methanothrix sp.]|nr:phosphoribosyl-AMP cyclohydrolase [Methanothrix sp.]